MMRNINVVFASDDNYAQHVTVAMASILLNTYHPERIHFYILSDKITSINCKNIKDTVLSFRGKITFINVDSDDFQVFVSGHINKAAYLRLQIADLLPTSIEKAIYFDSDLVVLDDIEKLWNISIQGKPIGAVCDYGIMASKKMQKQKHETIGLLRGDKYFNSGVIVFDLAQWRERKLGISVMKCISHNKFRHHDQDALNMVFMHDWYELPLCWNVIPPIFEFPLKILVNKRLRKKSAQVLKNPSVFHWAGCCKPWQFPDKGNFTKLYYIYLNQILHVNDNIPQLKKNIKTTRKIIHKEFCMRMAVLWSKIFS